MREILFRGRFVGTGEWVYGSLLEDIFGSYPCILKNAFCDDESKIGFDSIPVEPSTISQYTGLKDKNGRRIFEGDVVKDKHGRTGIMKYGPFYPSEYAAYPYSMYQQNIFGLYLEDGDKQFVVPEKPQIEVIGNIYENL